jgi:hypothetical protein
MCICSAKNRTGKDIEIEFYKATAPALLMYVIVGSEQMK